MKRSLNRFLMLALLLGCFGGRVLMADSVELVGSGQLTGKVARKGDLVIVESMTISKWRSQRTGLVGWSNRKAGEVQVAGKTGWR